MKQKLTPFVIGTCMLTLLAACGSDSDDNDSTPSPQPPQEEQQQEGLFRVTFAPIPHDNIIPAVGRGEFLIQEDLFKATVNFVGTPSATHRQYIYAGGACPTEDADTNNDGFIDTLETTPISGEAIIPLDSDLASQSAGGTFPSGLQYDYEQSTSYSAMLTDLQLPDSNENDNLVKLGEAEGLNLEGRVVIIHGIPTPTELPGTVQTRDNLLAQETLPMACGVITRDVSNTTTGGTTGP